MVVGWPEEGRDANEQVNYVDGIARSLGSSTAEELKQWTAMGKAVKVIRGCRLGALRVGRGRSRKAG